MPTASYRLGPPAGPVGPLRPTADQQQVVQHTGRRLRVLAGPGTGKTATIVEAVAQRVTERGIDPASILVLTFSRRAAGELTDRLTRRLALTTAEPLVRTLHSYAYSLLTAQALRDGVPPPRMLGAAESDRMVADLLAGHLAAGAGDWPGQLRPALGSRAFAAELRDLVLRTGERALSPARIVELGRRHRRPEWVAAGRLAKEYQQVVDLRMGTTGLGVALDQAELTLSALELLGRDEVLAAEQRRVRRVFVDEYQDVDPAQAALVERLAAGADELVVVGDPDQSIYGFRGADPGALRRIDVDSTVALRVSRRSGERLLAATRRVATLLPGTAEHRGIAAADGAAPGEVEIRTLPTAARQAAYIADRLRRAHLQQGVPWSQMAVVVRSPAAELPALRRAFSAVGVPLVAAADDRGVLADPLAAALVSLLECGLDPALLDGARAHELLTAPLGGAGSLDALALRRLRRAVRLAAGRQPAGQPAVAHRAAEQQTADGGASASEPGPASEPVRADEPVPVDEPAPPDEPGPAAEPAPTADLLGRLLAELATDGESPLLAGAGDDVARTARRLGGLLRTAREVATVPDGETALWKLWTSTGLQEDLVAASERGGRAGRRADEALDAVVALFDQAAELAARLPGAGVRAFVDQVHGEQLPGDPAAGPARGGEVVTVVSAHASKGLEWDLVVVAGVQEGSWPDLRTRSGLLATEDLLDLAAGNDPALSRVPAVLADERRLFYVACTRARAALVVTAVSGEESAPSRFLDELAGPPDATDSVPIETGWPRQGNRDRRALNLAELVGELRRVVTSPSADPAAASQAARQLARLADAGVPGAHPDQWYGLAGPSTEAPAVPPGEPVRVSPSAVEALQECALRGVLERRGARGRIADPQMLGMVVHAAAHGLSQGLGREAVAAEIDTFLATQDQLPDWQVRRLRRSITRMTTAVADWLDRAAAGGIQTVGSEVAVDLPLPAGGVPATDSGAASGADPAADDPGRGWPEPAPNPVRMTGRIDHLGRQPDGTLGVTDFKTASKVASVAEAEKNLQLAAYQVALALDGVPGVSGEPGGAQLLFVRDGTARERVQPPLEAGVAAETTGTIRAAAGHLAAATLPAIENQRCERCPVRTCCPLQSEGRQVTR